MFNEEGEWSDEEEAQTLSKSVFNKTQKTNTSSDVKVKRKQPGDLMIVLIHVNMDVCIMIVFYITVTPFLTS